MHKASIFEETSEVIHQEAFEENQFVITLKAPKASKTAKPGEFAFVDCGEQTLLRRPLSYLRTNPNNDTVEFMYKIIGPGLEALSKMTAGDSVKMMGPIGNGFSHDLSKQTPVFIGGGVGIPPVLFLAEYLKENNPEMTPYAFFGSEIPFPFETTESEINIEGLEKSNFATIKDMEEKQIPCRLASLANFKGCYNGYVTELVDTWLSQLNPSEKEKIILYACGPEVMLEAAAKLARNHKLDCQLSLEEFMACAIGGCAGCTVKVSEDEGIAMKRVCVDGPVFDAKAIYPQ